MKRISKLIALLLSLVMLTSLLCLPALADEEYDRYASLKEGTGYVAFGDSYTRGYGANENWEAQTYAVDQYGNFNCRNVDGSYPNLLAEYFGMYAPDDIRDTDAKMWNLSKNAQSLAYVLDLLGIDNGYRDEFVYNNPNLRERYRIDLAYFGDERCYNLEGTGYYEGEAMVMGIHELVENASLISLALGGSDVLYETQTLGLETIDWSDTENLPAAIANLVGMFNENFERWKNSYPLLLDYIKESNPDATVVLVGTMNPIQNVILTDEAAIPLCSAINLIMDMMNKCTREYAEEYGYIYIDISNVDTPSSETTMTVADALALTGDASSLMSHPTPNGYAQIARLIEAAVEETLPEYTPANPKTFISVDLGRFQSVDAVIVDGKTVDNYTMDGYVLTVPNYTTTAKSLAVTIVGEDGKIVVMTYSLSYDDGYTATRVYQTNDAEKTATSVFKTISKAIKSAWNSFVGLFKK